MRNSSIFISAGEASGDAHGAGVVRELRKHYPDAQLFGLGGDHMQEAGLELLEHVRRMSFMGFAEVVRHLPFFIALRRRVIREILRRQPDLLILIDYPGFHFALLKKLRRIWKKDGRRPSVVPGEAGRGRPKVLYYIAPQVWAWKGSRARELARLADHIAVIFPFEVEIFERHGGKATFVSHPLLDEVGEVPPRGQFLKGLGLEPDDRVIGLFAGSRKQEIKRHVPILLETVRLLRRFQPELKFVLAESPTVPVALYDRLLKDDPAIVRAFAVSHAVLAHANVSIVKSGSSTVEAAYFGNPFIVYYRTSPASYAIGKNLVRVPFIAMANILAGEEAVKEFVQERATAENLIGGLMPLLNIASEIEACRDRLIKVREKLGEPGAARRVAKIAASLMQD